MRPGVIAPPVPQSTPQNPRAGHTKPQCALRRPAHFPLRLRLLQVLRGERWKYVQFGAACFPPLLYDLEADPGRV